MRMLRRCAAAVPAVILLLSVPAFAQTTTTRCSGYANQVNCTSTTMPSADQQYQESMWQFQQGMAQLGAAIAQRRAAAAQQQAVWAAAATEQAREAASRAQANYDATTAALSRFATDTAPPAGTPVNRELVLDWSLLNGVESRIEVRGTNGLRWDVLRGWALTDTPEGGKILRMDATAKTMAKKQHISNIVNAIRYDPRTEFMSWTVEAQPLYRMVEPAYESAVRIGGHAFSTRMSERGYDVSVPPGTFVTGMLPFVIAAMPGELPASFRVWVVDAKAEVLPADVQVLGRKVVDEPVGPTNGTCADAVGRKEKRDAVTLKITTGVSVETLDVLAAAPHMVVHPDLKCRILKR